MVIGKLDISIMMNPHGEWDEDKGDHYTNLAIEGSEWEALYFDVLNVPKWETRIEDENSGEYYDRQKSLFQKNLNDNGYEMLGRIWDLYEDVFYLPSEVKKLLEECLEVHKKAQNVFAISALEKLMLACREALKISSGLCLLCD